jgi:hypothetical protein
MDIWGLAFLYIAFWDGYFAVNGLSRIVKLAIAVYLLNVSALTIK